MMKNLFGLRRVKSTKGDIFSPCLPCFHRQMTAIVTGNTYLDITPQYCTSVPWIAIGLTQMHTVRTKPLSERNGIVHDECCVMICADPLQWLRKRRKLIISDPFQPELERRNGRCRKRGAQLVRETRIKRRRRY